MANKGAFRKGEKRPGQGRPKGARAKRSEKLTQAMEAEGYDPQALIRRGFDIANDPEAKVSERIYAMATVLPYMLPKLSSIEVSGGDGKEPLRIKVIRDEPKEGGG